MLQEHFSRFGVHENAEHLVLVSRRQHHIPAQPKTRFGQGQPDQFNIGLAFEGTAPEMLLALRIGGPLA